MQELDRDFHKEKKRMHKIIGIRRDDQQEATVAGGSVEEQDD